MKFSHIADVHIGSWRDPKMKVLGEEAFIKSIDLSIQEKVDFVLIAGDLFNTAIPGIDQIKTVIKKIKQLKNNNIPVYYIAGSHDYSPSGKTMLDIIEEAGLGINVTKGKIDEDGKLQLQFTTDKKTGAKITGLIGRRGMLEKQYYEQLDTKSLEQEEGFKIFMFHTSIDELKPEELKEMESNPITFLPKNFDYYAGGHVHIVTEPGEKTVDGLQNAEYEKFSQLAKQGYKYVIYPGPTFPANFGELEKLGTGGFYIYNEGKLERKPLKIKETINKKITFKEKTPDEAEEIIKEELKQINPENKIILLRIEGTLTIGTTSQIKIKEIIDKLYKDGAYYVMKNTTKIQSKEFEEITTTGANNEEIETKIIKENIDQITHNFKNEQQIITELMKILAEEKNEGEKQTDYEERIQKNTEQTIKNQEKK